VFIIYGSDRPLDREAMAEAVQPAELTEQYVRRGRDIVLTDVYAPVDNLFCVVSQKR
jgi:hypothetical protein